MIPCPHCRKPIGRTHRCRVTLPVDPPVPPPSNLRELIAQARAEALELDADPRPTVVQLELITVDPNNRGGRP